MIGSVEIKNNIFRGPYYFLFQIDPEQRIADRFMSCEPLYGILSEIVPGCCLLQIHSFEKAGMCDLL